MWRITGISDRGGKMYSNDPPVNQKPKLTLVKPVVWVLFPSRPPPLRSKLEEDVRVPELIPRTVTPTVKDAD